MSVYFNYDPEEWFVFHDTLLAEHINQNKGQCDFIFINKRGILVLEVKEGNIGYKKEKLVQLADVFHRTERDITPFEQAEDNAKSIREYLMKNEITNCFVCSAVAFPESHFEPKGLTHKNVWSLSSKENLRDFLVNTMEENRYNTIEGLKRKYPAKAASYDKLWPEQNLARIDTIADLIQPRVNIINADASIQQNKEEASRRASDNMRILDGLRENRRIMIQGPAGSGKSKYALSLIKNKVLLDNAHGIYFCWNELLACKMNQRFVKEGISRTISAISLFPYICKLIKDAGLPYGTLSYKNITSTRDELDNAIKILKENSNLPLYDFMVFDEAQDMFDKGIDLLIENCLAPGKKGIENGEYLIFFDELQAFSSGINQQHYHFTLSYLKHHCAIYRMTDSFRTACVHGLQEFLHDLDTGVVNFKKQYGTDIKINSFEKIEKLPGLLLEAANKLKKTYKLKSDDFIILFSSNLVSGNEKNRKPLDDLLDPAVFLKLDNKNIIHASEKIKYTTALKFKGLDRDAVIVVINDLYNQEIQNLYQLYIGATRAKAKLYIFIDKESIKR